MLIIYTYNLFSTFQQRVKQAEEAARAGQRLAHPQHYPPGPHSPGHSRYQAKPLYLRP